jgi:flagellar biogenesis protein FliO
LSGKLKEAKENSISILSTIPIAQNKYLHLVEVRGQKLLIGSTANDIVMLKDIEDKKLN